MAPCRPKLQRKKRRGRGRAPLLFPTLLLAAASLLYYQQVSQRVLFAVGGRPGVQFRQLHSRWSRVSLLDLDLSCPGVRVEVAAADPTRRFSGCSNGATHTVADWCRTTGALAGINGGFFGRELGEGRKEIVGLLKLNGDLYGRAPRYRSRRYSVFGVRSSVFGSDGPKTEDRTPNTEYRPPFYAHSAIGFDAAGRPAIDWVASDPRRPSRIFAFEQAEGLRTGQPWNVASGLSGGPRLVARGRIAVSDRAERLASSGLLPRTFIGFAGVNGVPRYLVLGVATAMTFQDAATFLEGYFRRFHGLPCSEAMCLDGGPSSQLAYRADGVLYEAQVSETTVPTCLLVHAEPERTEEARRSLPGDRQ